MYEEAGDTGNRNTPKELGVQRGISDGSKTGIRDTGDGTSTSGNNITKNARPKECVNEDAQPNTKFKR